MPIDPTQAANVQRRIDKIRTEKEYLQGRQQREGIDFSDQIRAKEVQIQKLNVTKANLLSGGKREGIEKERQKLIEKKAEQKHKAVEYKGGCCEKCGYDKYIGALDFHHLDPKEKDFSISNKLGCSWNKIKKELDKCILVCSNCHREIHKEIRNNASVT